MAEIEIRDATEADLPGILRVLADSGIDGGHSFTVEEAGEHLKRIRAWPNFRPIRCSSSTAPARTATAPTRRQ